MRATQAIELYNIKIFPSVAEMPFHYTHISMGDREKIKKLRKGKRTENGLTKPRYSVIIKGK